MVVVVNIRTGGGPGDHHTGQPGKIFSDFMSGFSGEPRLQEAWERNAYDLARCGWWTFMVAKFACW